MDIDSRRKINDDRRRIFGHGDPGRVIAFVCECGAPTCNRTVQLTAAAYAAVRPEQILHSTHRQAGERSSMAAGG